MGTTQSEWSNLQSEKFFLGKTQFLPRDLSIQSVKTTAYHWCRFLQLIGLCFNNTYFLFHGQFYKHIEDAAMGSTFSPIMANLCMEVFGRALGTAENPPRHRKSYVWWQFVLQKLAHERNFLKHICYQWFQWGLLKKDLNGGQKVPVPLTFYIIQMV